MNKEHLSPGDAKFDNALYPVPAVMISCGDFAQKADCNIITLSWTGVLCSDPFQVYVSIRPGRHSHGIIKKYGDFVINLTTGALAEHMDFCGVKSGRDVDKFAKTGLTAVESQKVKAPSIGESPVNIECVVKEVKPLGTHDMFIADVAGISASDYDAASLVCNGGAKYYQLGEFLGGFGFSLKK